MVMVGERSKTPQAEAGCLTLLRPVAYSGFRHRETTPRDGCFFRLIPHDGRSARCGRCCDHREPTVGGRCGYIIRKDVVNKRNRAACGRKGRDAIWLELVFKDNVVVVESDVAFPLLGTTVDTERARTVIDRWGQDAVGDAAITHDRETRVLGVTPLTRLAGTREVASAVASVAQEREVALE